MSGRFNFLILVLKDEVDIVTSPAELRLYLSKKIKLTHILNQKLIILSLAAVDLLKLLCWNATKGKLAKGNKKKT